jgi:ribosome-associated protein
LEKRRICAILDANKLGVAVIAPRATTKKTTKPVKSAPRKAASSKAPTAKPAAKKAAAKPAAKSVKKSIVVKNSVTKTTKKVASPLAAKKASPLAKKTSGHAASAALCKKLASVLDENKGEDIVVLDLKDKCSFADFMIVASGRAPRHVSALADYVADALKKIGEPALSIEGKDSGDWVLIDAGDIVVHIFRPEVRQFYNIEKMWAIPAATQR